MKVTGQIAKHLKAFYHGENWTGVNLKDTLQGIDWQQATTKFHSFNTIAMLVFHMNYYVVALIKVIEGGPLDAHDKNSYDLAPIQGPGDWKKLLDKAWADAEKLIDLIEQLPDDRLEEKFTDEKYGNYFRNLSGLIEHNHYHLGQIVLIKKLLHQQNSPK